MEQEPKNDFVDHCMLVFSSSALKYVPTFAPDRKISSP
jgi:hypothetical protein